MHKCFRGIVVNCQYLSHRVTENEWKNDFVIPPHLKAGSLVKYCWSEPKNLDENQVALRDSYGLMKNPEIGSNKTIFGHDDLPMLRGAMRNDMKLVLKGIMTVEDAQMAVKAGANAVWISNGGSLKPEHAPSTLTVLKGISSALKSNT